MSNNIDLGEIDKIFILNDLAKLASSDSEFKSNTITFYNCI
jgi:hypothetical protein